MLNNPLIAVWSNAGKIQSSIRKTSKYSSPPVFGSDMSLKTIDSGTSTNATHLTYTFLCSKCAVPGAKLGWALSTSPVTTPADAATKLGYHMAGYGTFTVDLEKAKSAGFAGWAAKAA
jgi:cellobiose dehydrogenase (acceptor)